jgi:DNA-binding NarL/FixJ family response regulator
MINVGIVDDERIVLEGLQGLIRADAANTMTVIGAVTSVDVLIASLSGAPDVVVLDVFLENGTRLADNLRKLREWGAQVVILSRDDRSAELRRVAMRKGGALAFLNKEEGFEAIRSAIESAAAGDVVMNEQLMDLILREKVPLTEKQEKVAAFIAAGLSNAEIAKQMYITADVVKEHVKKIKERYYKAGQQVETRNKLIESLRDDRFPE